MSDQDEEVYQVITANGLRDGGILYLKSCDGDNIWTNDITEALVVPGSELDGIMEAAQASVTDNTVVALYPAEVAGHHDPLSARERIRAGGPTIPYGDDAVPHGRVDFDI